MAEGDKRTYQGEGFAGTCPGAQPSAEGVEPHQKAEMAATQTNGLVSTVEEVLAQGHAHYDDGIPAFPKVKFWEMGWEGTKFVVTRDTLRLRRGKESLDIPLSSIQSMTLASGAWGPRVALRYQDGEDERVLRLSWSTLWGPKAQERLVASLVGQGVSRVYAVENGQERDISDQIGVDPTSGSLVTRVSSQPEVVAPQSPTQPPRPGLFAPWYAKEPGPLVVKKYQDNWVERGNMNRDIREASVAGWQVAQTETVSGHLNAGWLVLMILFFWTVIIPLFALFNLRSVGKFVVTFQKVANPSAPQPQTATPIGSQEAQVSASALELLEQLQELREKGLISEDEFETRRQAVLEQRFAGHS